MTEDSNRDELIEQYLMGELSGDRLGQFEEKFATDEEFRKEVALQKAIIRNIRAAGRAAWAQKLESMHDEIYSNSNKTAQNGVAVNRLTPIRKFYKNKYFTALAIAASVLIILFSTLMVMTKNNKTGADEIFIAYYQPYPDLEQKTRSLSPEVTSVKKEAFRAYDEGRYQESIRLFKNVLESGNDEMVLFYLGNALLSANKPQEAERVFKRYLSQYKEFAVESRWYLSLTYLKEGKLNDARILLNELAKENNDFSKKAAAILDKQSL